MQTPEEHGSEVPSRSWGHRPLSQVAAELWRVSPLKGYPLFLGPGRDSVSAQRGRPERPHLTRAPRDGAATRQRMDGGFPTWLHAELTREVLKRPVPASHL